MKMGTKKRRKKMMMIKMMMTMMKVKKMTGMRVRRGGLHDGLS